MVSVFKNLFLLFFFSATVLVPAIWLTLNYNGFCMAEKRWLSDSEKFDIGLHYTFRHYPPQRFRIPGFYSKKIINHVQYLDFDDFVRRNPDCCSMSETGWKGLEVSSFKRLTGFSGGFVKVEYFADADGFTEKDREWILQSRVPSGFKPEQLDELSTKNQIFVALTNCGVIWSGY